MDNEEQKQARRYRGPNKQPTMIYVAVRMPKDMLEWLKARSKSKNMRLSDTIRYALTRAIEQEKNNAS